MTKPIRTTPPLKRHSALAVSALLLAALAPAARAQMPLLPPVNAGPGIQGPLPQFDVISIKPHDPKERNMRIRWAAGGYEASNVSLKDLIATVYGVKQWLVFGLPAWTEKGTWDVQAKVSEPDKEVLDKLSIAQRLMMMRSILNERFGFQAHQESKVQPVYELSVLPDGPRFKPTEAPPAPTDGSAPKPPMRSFRIGRGLFSGKGMEMITLADSLANSTERVVLDKTGLTGRYDIDMKWTPEDRAATAADNGAEAPPDIYTALKEQLGLKLTAARAPVPTVVVDHIEQPQEN